MSREELIRLVTEQVIKHLNGGGNIPIITGEKGIPVGISNRHLHLSQEHVDVLFGRGYQLTLLKKLQPGEYAAKETVQVIGPQGAFKQVRIIGPVRPYTQVEISRTDGYILGINPPVRDSSMLKGSPGVVLVGPEGCLGLKEGVIAAARHIHMHPGEAQSFRLKNGDKVRVGIDGERGLTFSNVLIRVHENYRLEMHIDTDEANAAGINNGDTVYILDDPEGG